MKNQLYRLPGGEFHALLGHSDGDSPAGKRVARFGRPNLVVNDGFETGSFPSWVTAGDTNGLSVAQNGSGVQRRQGGMDNPMTAHTGSWFAVFATQGASEISQVVSGNFQSFDLNFWAAGAGFSILWGGQLIDDGAINGSGAGQGLGGGGIADGIASDRPDLVIQTCTH